MRALLIENRLERPESWKEDKPYGFHLSLKQLQESEWGKFRDRFDLIFEAMDIKPPETLKKESITRIRFKNESEKQTLLDWIEKTQSELPEEAEQIYHILQHIKDSAFSDIDMAGHQWDLSDGEYNIPVVMDVKDKGTLSFFRAKTYVMHDDSEEDGKETVYGRHGWQYFVEDFLRCRLGGLKSQEIII